MDDNRPRPLVAPAPSFWNRAQAALFFLLLFVTPLVVNPWGMQPFTAPPVALARSLIWILAALYLARHLAAGRARPATWRDPLAAAILLLCVVLLVTTATAVDPGQSFWGSSERGQGALTQLSYLLLLLLAARQARRPGAARALLVALALTAVPLLIAAAAQAAGWRPLGLTSDARSPLTATLGRANFLAAYLAMLVPLTASLALTARRRVGRWGWAAALLGCLLAIALSGARAAWLAAAVALAVFALLGFVQRRRWALVGLLALLAPVAAALLWAAGQTAGSAAARWAIWRGVWALVRERPLLGYGADALGQVFPRVYPPELVYLQGREFFVDRAHNWLLEWTAAVGLPGLLALLLLLALVGGLAQRALYPAAQARWPVLPRQRRILLAGVCAALAANLTNNLFSFDVTATAVAFWLLLGVVVGVAGRRGAGAREQGTENGELSTAHRSLPTGRRPASRRAHSLLAALLITATLLAAWQVNGRLLLADHAAGTAARLAGQGDYRAALAAAETAVARWPVDPAYYLLLSRAYRASAAQDPALAAEHVAQGQAALRRAQEQRPHDPRTWLETAAFYEAAAALGWEASGQLDAAYSRALALAPNQATIYAAWSEALERRGDSEAARALRRTAARLDATLFAGPAPQPVERSQESQTRRPKRTTRTR